MAKDQLSGDTVERLARFLEAFEAADALTRIEILSKLLGSHAYVVEITQHVSQDLALNITLTALEVNDRPPPIVM